MTENKRTTNDVLTRNVRHMHEKPVYSILVEQTFLFIQTVKILHSTYVAYRRNNEKPYDLRMTLHEFSNLQGFRQRKMTRQK